MKYVETKRGPVPVVSTKFTWADRVGAWRVRLNIRRMGYRVEPGLYAVGTPHAQSPVFVSANYRLSFDYLCRELTDISCWILVLDTNGINVWCAAGKGTFGTDELLKRINEVQLAEVVSHRTVIVPQLGAPGVAAHRVSKKSGFNVLYGPVRATDIPAFVKNKMTVTTEMRRVLFPLKDRVALVGVEFTMGIKYTVEALVIIFILSGITKGGYASAQVLTQSIPLMLSLVSGFIMGAGVVPLLLPYIPLRAFSAKGFLAEMVVVVLLYRYVPGISSLPTLTLLAFFLIGPTLASFLAMNFTGASTYTSLSGVLKEMKSAIPLQVIAAVVAMGALMVRFLV